MNAKTPAATRSIRLDELSLEQLVLLQQGLGAQIDALRKDRAHLAQKIAARLAAGERTSTQGADAQAPGAVIEAGLGG